MQELEQLIGKMHRTFSDFAGHAIASEISKERPELGHHLHTAVEQFLQLLRQADLDAEGRGDASKDGSPQRYKREKTSRTPSHSSSPTIRDLPEVAFGESFVPDPMNPPIKSDIHWGYSFDNEDGR